MCLIFNHDALHQGCPVFSGKKYVARSEIIFRKIAPELHPDPMAFSRNPKYLKFITLYHASQDSLAQGNPNKFLDLYYEALKMQVAEKRKSTLLSEILTVASFPTDIWVQILLMLSLRDALAVMTVSKNLCSLILDGEIWQKFYTEEFLDDNSEELKINPHVEDWYRQFKIRYFFTYSLSTFAVIDVGSTTIRYLSKKSLNLGKSTKTNSQIFEIPSLYKIVERRVQHHYRDVIRESAVGIGTPILKKEAKHLSYCKDFTKVIEKLVINPSTVCVIASPDKLLPNLHINLFQVVQCDASVGSLYAYGKLSGLVFSIGNSFPWVQSIINGRLQYSYVFTAVYTIVDYVIIDLVGYVNNWLQEPAVLNKIVNDKGAIDVCCIGGKFDEVAVKLLSAELKKLSQQSFSIISEIEDRVISPIVGSLCLYGQKMDKYFKKHQR